MSLKGTVKIERYSSEIIDGEWVPLELLETIEQPNRITPNLMDYMRMGASTGRNDMVTHVTESMILGAMCVPTDNANQGWVGATVAVAAVYNAGVEGGADSYWEIKSQVNGKGSGNGDRNIRTIALTSSNGSYDNKAWTIVNLPTPCVQGETEILQITYRLINDQSAIAALNSVNYDVSEFIFQYNTHGGNDSFYPSLPSMLSYDETVWGTGIPWYTTNRINPTNNPGNSDLYYTNAEKQYIYEHSPQGLHRVKTWLQLGVSNNAASETLYTGIPIKSITMANTDRFTGVSNITSGTGSRVQNIFGRDIDTGAQDRVPFFDSNHIASSAATVNLVDKGDWVEHRSDSYLIPYHYRITVETGGLTGAATYKLQRRRFTHWAFNDNYWVSYGIHVFHCGLSGGNVNEAYLDVTTADSRKHGQTLWHSRSYTDGANNTSLNSTASGDTGTIFLRYVYPEAITFDYDGLTVFSLKENGWTNLDANSTQAQTFTEILQVSTDGLDIYVADASQGLYKVERDHDDFDTSNWTITKLSPPGITDTDSCRGVFHKGGTYWAGPGKVTEVVVVRGGSNYTVGDTVTITGVNGTGATAEVGAVDADGAITSITVTAQGNGYIEDHIQVYVSSGNGVGAQLDPIIGAGGDMWTIFNDATDNQVYMAHMTHVTTSGDTNMNFDTTGDTITRTGGDFLTDGFRPGQTLIVRTAEDAANNGRFTITAVTSTVITVSENLTTNATDTQAQLFGEKWEIMTETITTTESLTFADANPDTIVGTSGTTLQAQGFREGMEIVVSGSVSNNGTYTIADVTGNTITLDSQDTLVAEGPVSCTLATLTDFTLTNYTADSTEGAGIIGLVMDQEHADGRFAIFTPGTKYVNNGTVGNANGSWSWWDYAASTGTTAAGASEETFVTGDGNSYALSGEQICTLTCGPLSDGDTWVVKGSNNASSARVDFGLTTLTGEGYDVAHRYHSHRCKTNFDIGVYGEGTDGTNHLKSNRVAADFTTGTQDSIIAAYLTDPAFDNIVRTRPGSWGGAHANLYGQFGHGLLFGRMADAATNLCGGGYVYSNNGNGIKSTEDELPYGYWETFGWDGTDWVLDEAGAKTAHAQVSFSGTGITITAASGTIVGAGFTDWATDGFLAGDIITIENSEDASNNGSYVIESLSGTTLTVTPDKLPAVDTTSAPDTTATVVGDHALIDGLAISFDTSGAAPLVVDEYYECYLYDGIINDNATSGSVDSYAPYMATATGTDFESSTIPNSDVGTIVGDPITISNKSAPAGANVDDGGAYFYSSKPGILGSSAINNNISNCGMTEQQIPASTDFTFKFKAGGSALGAGGPYIDVGIMPYTDAADASQKLNTVLDYNIRPQYDYINNPTCDIYTVEVRSTGAGGVISTYNADRVVLIEDQIHTNYTGGGGNGTFIGGYESATDNHAALDVITMNDGTLVTVDAVDGNGTVTEFTITTNSTKSSGNGEIDAVASSATSIDFNTTGNVITRTAGGTDFVTDGFRIGMKIQVDGATTEANDGAYTIQSVTTTTIVTEENLDTTETGTSATIQHAIVQVSTTGSGVNFAIIPGTNNIEAADVGNDEFALNRRGTTGNNLYWTVNGVEFYTHTSGPYNDQYSPAWTTQGTELASIYDATLDYTIDRRYLKIGNGTTTGAFSPNFRCLPTLFAGTNKLRLYIDGTEATYVTDGRTAPAAGEISILPYSGVLWFNTADAGKTLTGNWTTTLAINIQ